jgi:hypothetical protein
MAGRFVHEDDAKQMAIESNIAHGRSAMGTISELTSQLKDAHRIIAAMVIDSGGRVCVSDRTLAIVEPTDVEIYREEENRRYVMRRIETAETERK